MDAPSYQSLKNLKFHQRLSNACSGFGSAVKTEASLRAHLLFASLAFCALLVLRPQPIWWALVALTIGAVLAAELFNTALEMLIDRLHPERHPLIGRAKDCAAAAVLVLSVAALMVAIAMVASVLE